MRLRSSARLLACSPILLLASDLSGKEPPLPEPAWTLPVDVDGDGTSSYGDQYVFNDWLSQGGDIARALASASAKDEILDLSDFFAGQGAALSTHSPLAWEEFAEEETSEAAVLLLGSGLVGPQGAGADPNAPNFTRRLPSQATNAQLNQPSQDPRMTPDGRFIVFSSAAALPGFTTPAGIRQIYRLERGSGSTTIITLVSVDSGSTAAAQHCDNPAISDDGNVVVFQTTARLVSFDPAPPAPQRSDIYARVLAPSATTRLLSVRRNAQGNPVTPADGDSTDPAISGNGLFAAFTSTAENLNPVDENGLRDVFRVRTDGVSSPELASIDNSSQQSFSARANFSTVGLAGRRVGRVISADGTRVLFHGTPCDWVDPRLCPAQGGTACGASCESGAQPSFQQVYVRDFDNPFLIPTELVSRAVKAAPVFGGFNLVPGQGNSQQASISADGSRIAFSSLAINFSDTTLTVDPDSFEDVFFVNFDDILIPDPATVPVRVSRTASGPPVVTNGHSFAPVLSSTGQRIAFSSASTNLIAGDTNGRRDIFISDFTVLAAPVMRRFSVTSAGQQATGGDSGNPDVSADGKLAAYHSLATNLIGGDSNGRQDIFETLSPQGDFKRGDADDNGVLSITDAHRG